MILVGCTMASYVCDREETSVAWLYKAEMMRALSPEPLEFFVTFEVDARGLEPFAKVIERLQSPAIEGTYNTFSYGGRDIVNSSNRLWRICMGRNLIQDHAMDIDASHILFLDADTEPPANCIENLLALNYPITGGEVPTYGLTGPKVMDQIPDGLTDEEVEALPDYPEEWDVQEHMNTAGFLMVARSVFSKIRWRYSGDDGMTDDPCYFQDAKDYLGFPTYVRHDTKAIHHPQYILPIERRFPDRDMKVYS